MVLERDKIQSYKIQTRWLRYRPYTVSEETSPLWYLW